MHWQMDGKLQITYCGSMEKEIQIIHVDDHHRYVDRSMMKLLYHSAVYDHYDTTTTVTTSIHVKQFSAYDIMTEEEEEDQKGKGNIDDEGEDDDGE